MTFLSPSLLWLFLAVPLVWIVPRPARKPLQAALRTLTLALLVVALARPVFFGSDAQPVRVVVLDATASLDTAVSLDESGEDTTASSLAARVFAQGGTADERRVLIGIGAENLAVPEGVELVRVPAQEGAPGASDLETALAMAAASVPAGTPASVTVVSDGAHTHGTFGRGSQALAQRGIPVHVVAATADGDRPRLVGLDVDRPARVGRTVRVTATLEGRGRALRGVLSVDGVEQASRELLLLDGRTRVAFEFEPKEAGFAEVALTFSGPEGALPAGSLTQTVGIQDPLRVLYGGERLEGAQDKFAALVGRGFEFTRWDPRGTPALPPADLLILDDLPAERVPETVREEIADAVRQDGLGLLMSGGRSSFGGGGWHKTPVADVLPVEFVQREEKRDPSTTLVVIIDTSGSMGGSRVQLAKEVARLSIRRLLPHDKVGIVEFFGAKRWAAPIQPASNNIEIERALNRLNAGGGTVIMPAIEEAFYGLQNVRTRYKHVLVLTDGGVEQGAFEPLVRRMASRGINVSTVLIGPQAHSEFLVSIANWGKGRFYNVPNRFNLPELILKQPASARLPPYRPGTVEVDAEGGAGWWGSSDDPQVPSLGGYVESSVRPGAQTVLRVREKSQPLLATWRAGLGRTTAFLSEPTGEGTASWSSWDGYGPWLARVLARTAADGGPPLQFTLVREGAELVLHATRRASARLDVWPTASVHLPGEEEDGAAFEFESVADGVFRARLPWAPSAAARVIAGAKDEDATPRVRLASDPFADVAPEAQVDPLRGIDLARLARATGGQAVALEDLTQLAPRAGGVGTPWQVTVLWPWFALLALTVWLVELFMRRRSRRAATPAATPGVEGAA